MMPRKTETISAAEYRATGGKRKVAIKAPAHAPMATPVFAPSGEVPSGARYCFTYSGPVVSANKTFAGLHWAKRATLTDKWHGIFAQLLTQAEVQPMRCFRLGLCYNSRHDCDNLVLICKWLADTLKGKYVPDDSKQYYRGISIVPTEGLPHNTFVFTITDLTPCST